MPTYVKSLRNVLDADANATAINANAFLYSTQAEAINAGEQLFIISEHASRIRQAYEQIFGFTQETAGGAATASMKDSSGNFPDPVFGFFSSGVQIGFEQPQWGFPTMFPVSSYGIQGGITDNVGLRHYHHQIQYGLYLDGTQTITGSWFGGTVVTDYMEDIFSSNGTVLEAGGGNGTWDQNNISLGDLRGINKPVTAVAGTSGFGVATTNILLGDPLGTQGGTGFGAGEATGYFTEDGVDKTLANSTSAHNISIGGFGDGI